MQKQRNVLLSLGVFALLAGCAADANDDMEQRQGLLFGLDDEDVALLHDAYLPDEDLDLTTARLTAPFDCELYDDLCSQIGREAAIEFTAELVDLALDGATAEEIDAFNDEFLMSAMDAYEPGEDDITHRASGSWRTATSGNVRLRVRNGITTPVIGSRQAWTEGQTQRRNALGIWSSRRATQLCVDTGTNTQTYRVSGWGTPTTTTTIESFNPSQTCVSDASSHKSRTYHVRRSGYSGHGLDSSYEIIARGSASGEINGASLSRTGSAFNRVY